MRRGATFDKSDDFRRGPPGDGHRAVRHAGRRDGPRRRAGIRYVGLPLHRQAGLCCRTSRRTLDIYVVEDEFDAAERERIGLALQQWNHVLNGYVRFRAWPLPGDPSDADPDAALSIRRLDRDQGRPPPSRRPRAQGVGRGGVASRNGGFVYVVDDRFGRRDLTAVMLHELGHVLGAGHDPNGHLMAPVYDRTTAIASTAAPSPWSRRRSICRSTSSTGALARAWTTGAPRR